MELLSQIGSFGKQLAILIDPEKSHTEAVLLPLLEKINVLMPHFIFVGGSTVNESELGDCIHIIKANTTIPVIIFPGSHMQIHNEADGILFLSLISGRNPDYLIGHQIEAAHILKNMPIEVIPTGYILIDGEKNSSVAYVSQTTPIPNDQISIAVHTAIAGEMLGLRAIFMDAGSGAKKAITAEMIKEVCHNINIPLIIGGGLRSITDIQNAFDAGANIVVIGNKIEEDIDFLLDIKSLIQNDRH